MDFSVLSAQCTKRSSDFGSTFTFFFLKDVDEILFLSTIKTILFSQSRLKEQRNNNNVTLKIFISSMRMHYLSSGCLLFGSNTVQYNQITHKSLGDGFPPFPVCYCIISLELNWIHLRQGGGVAPLELDLSKHFMGSGVVEMASSHHKGDKTPR